VRFVKAQSLRQDHSLQKLSYQLRMTLCSLAGWEKANFSVRKKLLDSWLTYRDIYPKHFTMCRVCVRYFLDISSVLFIPFLHCFHYNPFRFSIDKRNKMFIMTV